MGASVDVDEDQIRELDRLAKEDRRPRAALIRDAIGDYLEKRRHKTRGDAFGLWGDRKVDGLRYQEKVRGEW